MRTRTVGFIAFLFVLVVASVYGQTYRITDLGPLTPTAINTWGQVVGTVGNHGFMWTRNQGLRDLGMLPSGTFTRPTGINDLGWVTGTADGAGVVLLSPPNAEPNLPCSNLTQPFLWKPGSGLRGLGTVPTQGGIGSELWCSTGFYGLGINDLGQVAGYTEDIGTSFQWAFVWERNTGIDLFAGNWVTTNAFGISNTSQIVGQDPGFFVLEPFGHAFSWQNGVMTDLGVLASDTDPLFAGYLSSANGVNDLGQIVGWASTSASEPDPLPAHAVLWTRPGELRDLGTLPGDTSSVALKINLFGQVIGSSGNTYTRQSHGEPGGSLLVFGRPFIWSERNGMRDLNTLIPGYSRWVLKSAADINVWGQIVGSGTRNGQPHGFLLTPKKLFRF